jgi:hypothetical protein
MAKVLAAALACTCLVAASDAAAQSPGDVAATPAQGAEALFERARVLMDQGNFTAACPLFAESNALDPEAGTVLNLAYCYEKIGRTATAFWLYVESAIDADRHQQKDRAAFARYRQQELEPHLSRVRISVALQPARDDIEVGVAGHVFPPSEWGPPVPMDPGEYELHARAPGYLPWSVRFVVDDGHQPSIVVPELEPSPAPPPPAEPEIHPPIVVPIAWAALGLGLAATATGAGFGLSAIAHDDVANQDRNCVRNVCNATGASERHQARVDATVADVTFAVGAGALIVAGALALTRLHPSSPPASSQGWTIVPLVAEDRWALAVGRSW